MDELIQLVNDADPMLWGEGKPRHVVAGAVLVAFHNNFYGESQASRFRPEKAYPTP